MQSERVWATNFTNGKLTIQWKNGKQLKCLDLWQTLLCFAYTALLLLLLLVICNGIHIVPVQMIHFRWCEIDDGKKTPIKRFAVPKSRVNSIEMLSTWILKVIVYSFFSSNFRFLFVVSTNSMETMKRQPYKRWGQTNSKPIIKHFIMFLAFHLHIGTLFLLGKLIRVLARAELID